MNATIQPVLLPIQFNQLIEIVQQLGSDEREKLLFFLLKKQQDDDALRTHFASEKVLARDWADEKEDAAWQSL